MRATSVLNRRYGWKPSLPTNRVERYRPELKLESELPQSTNNRAAMTPCYDQGQLGSCTANAIAGSIEHRLIVDKYKWQFTPSRLMIYYLEREIEGTVYQDAGANIFDGINAVNKYGVCPEAEADGSTPPWLWTYDDTPVGLFHLHPKFTQKPPAQCYQDARLHKALKTSTVTLGRLTVLNTLAAGHPIVFGFTVEQSFEDQTTIQTGIMPIPATNEQVLGGHAVVAFDYLLNTPLGNQGVKDWAIIRNSWGTNIYTKNPKLGNLAGYFLMPLDAILCNPQVSSDAHIIQLVGA